MAKSRQKRLYSLFELQDGKWVRVAPGAFFKEQAVQVYQSRLLAPFLGGAGVIGERRLQVVKD